MFTMLTTSLDADSFIFTSIGFLLFFIEIIGVLGIRIISGAITLGSSGSMNHGRP